MYSGTGFDSKPKLIFKSFPMGLVMTLKAPITTAADDKLCDICPKFRKEIGMIFHEKSCFIC